jgi:hypothetical protein
LLRTAPQDEVIFYFFLTLRSGPKGRVSKDEAVPTDRFSRTSYTSKS